MNQSATLGSVNYVGKLLTFEERDSFLDKKISRYNGLEEYQNV